MNRFSLIALLATILLIVPVLPVEAGRGNPFELQERLPDVKQGEELAVLEPAEGSDQSRNPFNIRGERRSDSAERENVVLVRQGERRAVLDARGRLLGIHLFMLLLLGVFWTLMRPSLTAAYRSQFNSGIFNQLYRNRSGNNSGSLLVCYLFSFLSMGFFAYLVARQYDWLPGDRPWPHWLLLSAAVAGFFAFKHLMLRLAGWLWEAPKSTSQYSFFLQTNTLLLGMALVPANLLVSYAPKSTTGTMITISLALVLAAWIVRLLRGLNIGMNSFGKNPLLFLLYICAIEIAPLALLFRFVYDWV